jgi:hypothetical protein
MKSHRTFTPGFQFDASASWFDFSMDLLTMSLVEQMVLQPRTSPVREGCVPNCHGDWFVSPAKAGA